MAQQTGFDSKTIDLNLKLLDDLNLDSIKAGDLIANATKKFGVAGKIDPSSLTNATLKDIAAAIKAVMPPSEPTQAISTEEPSINLKDPEQLLSKLDQLSEQELNSLLMAYSSNN